MPVVPIWRGSEMTNAVRVSSAGNSVLVKNQISGRVNVDVGAYLRLHRGGLSVNDKALGSFP